MENRSCGEILVELNGRTHLYTEVQKSSRNSGFQVVPPSAVSHTIIRSPASVKAKMWGPKIVMKTSDVPSGFVARKTWFLSLSSRLAAMILEPHLFPAYVFCDMGA